MKRNVRIILTIGLVLQTLVLVQPSNAFESMDDYKKYQEACAYNKDSCAAQLQDDYQKYNDAVVYGQQHDDGEKYLEALAFAQAQEG